MHFINLLLVIYHFICCGLGKVDSNEKPATRDYFYVGGHYVTAAAGHLFTDQMYIERLQPSHGPCKPYPAVFIHGQAQTGTVGIYML
jgi:hypothetical protein